MRQQSPNTVTTPSVFDLSEGLEQSLRSRHIGTTWLAEIEAKLHAYRASLARHIHQADGDDGWIAGLCTDNPRIETLARRTRADFDRLDEHVLSAMVALRRPNRLTREIRRDVRRLVDLTAHHRARCARLMHEAIVVDLGGVG